MPEPSARFISIQLSSAAKWVSNKACSHKFKFCKWKMEKEGMGKMQMRKCYLKLKISSPKFKCQVSTAVAFFMAGRFRFCVFQLVFY